MTKNNMGRLAALGLSAALLAVLAGCSEQPVAYEEKQYTVSAAEVDSLVIEVRDREVEVLPSEDGQLHISYYESEKEFYAMDLSKEKTLSMVCADNKAWDDYVGGKTARENRIIRVSVPEGALQNLTLATTNENISLSPLSFGGAVSLENNNGDITLEQVAVGSALTLNVKNGIIGGSVAGAYGDFSITSTVKKGKSNLPERKADGAKELSATANNGDVAIEFSK